MPRVVFTSNLQRHIECPAEKIAAGTVRELLNKAFETNKKLKNYVLDDQDRLRPHMLVIVDGIAINDRVGLSDKVLADSEVYVMQALSGG